MKSVSKKLAWNLVSGTAGAALAVVMMTCAAQAQSKPPIKVVHTAPLTGQLGSVGKLQGIAIDIAVDDVNKAGGINGSMIEIVRVDDQLRPDQGVLRVREAASSGAIATLGPLSGGQWETAYPTFNQLKIPAINMNSSKSGIKARPYGTRLNTPDDVLLPKGLDAFITLFPNTKKVAVMADIRDSAGKAALDLWQQIAKAKGLEVVGTIEFTSGASDFSPMAIRLKDLKPDAVLAAILSGDAARFARELQIQNVTTPIMNTQVVYPGVFPQVAVKSVGEQAKQWYTVGQASNDMATGDAAKYKSFVTRYNAAIAKDEQLNQFQPPNVSNAALGYDAVIILADAARKAGIDGNTPIADARTKLMEGINATKTYKGLNAISFNADGDGNSPVGILQVDPATSTWKFVTPLK